MVGEDDWDALKARIDGLDEDGLRMTIGIMALELGAVATSKAIDAMYELRNGPSADALRAPGPDEIRDRVSSILMHASENAADIYEFDFDEDDPEEGFADCEDHLMREGIEEEYADLCIDILEYGDPEEVRKVVEGVAEALRDRDIPWRDMSENVMGFRRMFADAIEERYRNGEFRELFGDID